MRQEYKKVRRAIKIINKLEGKSLQSVLVKFRKQKFEVFWLDKSAELKQDGEAFLLFEI